MKSNGLAYQITISILIIRSQEKNLNENRYDCCATEMKTRISMAKEASNRLLTRKVVIEFKNKLDVKFGALHCIV
jgi:hypothetical protein